MEDLFLTSVPYFKCDEAQVSLNVEPAGPAQSGFGDAAPDSHSVKSLFHQLIHLLSMVRSPFQALFLCTGFIRGVFALRITTVRHIPHVQVKSPV